MKESLIYKTKLCRIPPYWGLQMRPQYGVLDPYFEALPGRLI